MSSKKNLRLRLGASIRSTEKEIKVVCNAGPPGKAIIQSKVATKNFTRNGEPYAPGNTSHANDGKWVFDKAIAYDFCPQR